MHKLRYKSKIEKKNKENNNIQYKKTKMGYLTVPQNYSPNDDEQSTEVVIPNMIKKNGRRCYYSDIVGNLIVDAITGEQYPWRVGSLNEQRFFKVIDTTNIADASRKNNYNQYQGRSSRKAYYENPHAFMRYKGIELDAEIVNNWYEKVNMLFPGEYTQADKN